MYLTWNIVLLCYTFNVSMNFENINRKSTSKKITASYDLRENGSNWQILVEKNNCPSFKWSINQKKLQRKYYQILNQSNRIYLVKLFNY